MLRSDCGCIGVRSNPSAYRFPPLLQDEDHPELRSAIRLKITDLLLSSEDEPTRAKAVRDVERSVLQVIRYRNHESSTATTVYDYLIYWKLI